MPRRPREVGLATSPGLDTEAIVVHIQAEVVVLEGQADGEVGGLGVTGDVGEDFLKDSEEGGGLV